MLNKVKALIIWKSIFIILSILCFSKFVVAEELTGSDIFQNTKNSVVLIKVFDNNDKLISQGTGIAFKDDALFTNWHVVKDAKKITISNSMRNTTAEVILYSEELDVAVLSSKQHGYPLINFASTPVAVGDEVYALGNPLGLENSLSSGIVSGLRGKHLQITSPLSPGSSGGLVTNNQGEAVGMATSSYTQGQNVNLAISFNELTENYSSYEWLAPQEIKNAPLLQDYYIFEGKPNQVDMIKISDLVVSNGFFFLTTSTRVYTEQGEKSKWIELSMRQQLDCARQVSNPISSTMLFYDTEKDPYTLLEDTVQWVAFAKNKGTRHYFEFICKYGADLNSLKKIAMKKHFKNLININEELIRKDEIYVLDFIDQEFYHSITPLGEFLIENHKTKNNLWNVMGKLVHGTTSD